MIINPTIYRAMCESEFSDGRASRDDEVAELCQQLAEREKQVTLLLYELNTIYKMVPDLVTLMKLGSTRRGASKAVDCNLQVNPEHQLP